MADLQIAAGSLSSFIFVASSVPMVSKAMRTRSLGSYSLGNIILANIGNLLYWLYVISLPLGPIWFLHGFNTFVALLMLGLYLRHETLFYREGRFTQDAHEQRRDNDH